MMRKAGLIAAALCLAAAMCMSVPASDQKAPEEKEKYEEVGMDIPTTEEMKQAKGYLMASPLGALDGGHHVYGMAYIYTGMPSDEALKIMYSNNATEEEYEELLKKQSVVRIIAATDAGYDEVKAACENLLAGNAKIEFGEAEEIGSADGFTFYSLPVTNPDEYFKAIEEEYAEDFKKMDEALDEALKIADYYAPLDEMKEMSGLTLSFTTTDLDGNTVTSKELFADNEITMINCWGVWCPNCVYEMEELAQMHERLKEKGCGIVGLEWEKEPTEDTYDMARQMLLEWGTGYPNALMPEEVLQYLNGFPTTIFVDKEGKILGYPIEGAAVSQYEPTLEALLAGKDAAPEPDAKEVKKSTVTYVVKVTDEAGPVEEVTIQFCDENTCRIGETGEDGEASFEVPAGVEYEVHVMEVPDGYKEDETVYHTTEGSFEVEIKLEKEN